MKPLKFVALLLLVSTLTIFRSVGQTPRIAKVGCSEYRVFYLCENKRVYAVLWNDAVNANAITQYNMNNKDIVHVAGGLYHGLAIDADGYAWTLSNKKAEATRISTDDAGQPFTGNITGDAYFHTNITVKSDGTIWYWGNDDYNLFPGSTPVNNPVQLNMPAGVKFKKVSCGRNLLALATNGDVYEYITGNPKPVKISLPRPATDIASGNGFSVAIVPDNLAAGEDGWPYGWGPDGGYLGRVNTGLSNPVALKSDWGITVPIRKVTANHNVIHFIDANGNLWGMGDNAIGEVGNGEEKVNHAETYSTPYVWDWARNGMLVTKPVQIGQGKTYTDIFTGSSYAFYHYAIATDNTVYSWGRNKTLALGNGLAINQEANYPNALDVLKPTLVDPMKQTVRTWDFKPYTINAGPNRTITLPQDSVVMNGKAVSSSGYTIASYKWTKVSGPNTFKIEDPSSPTTAITGLGAGTYVFNLQMTDNNTGTISGRVTIVVNPGTSPANKAPVPKAGDDKKKVLPDNSVSLDGSDSYDTDGTIVGWKWEKTAGPNTFTITDPGAAATTVTGLVEGTYTFRLTVTDDKGATASDDVQVIVEPAPNKAPVARAGNDITITLPVDSVKLDGSGSSDADGKIAGYKWTKISGPGSFTIVSHGSAITSVTDLVAGTYKFELTVTDDKGLTATDQVVVTVNSSNPPANQAPVARAGNDATITLPLDSVKLDGSSSSDADGKISVYKWVKVAGPGTFNITNPNAAVTSVTALVAGTYKFELTVTDDKGLTATDQVTITVNAPANKAPVARAGNDITITLPLDSVKLDGSGSSDADGKIATYRWVKISGPGTYKISNPGSAITSVTGLVTGVYSFELTVTDDKGLTAKDQVTVTVNPAPNKPPVARAGSDITKTLPDNTFQLDGSASYDPDGKIVSYAWVKITGPSPFTMSNPNTVHPTLLSLLPGVYEIELTVTDDKGATGKDRIIITILPANNKAPKANAGDDQQITGSEFTLDGTASTDEDGTIQSYAWKQVTGPSNAAITFANADKTPVTIQAAGTYEFELTVTDEKGAKSTDRVVIIVSEASVHMADSVSLYPVPAGNNLTVKITGAETGKYSVTVYNSSGGMVLYRELIKASGVQLSTIDMYNLKAGAYVVVIMSPDGKKINRIISKL